MKHIFKIQSADIIKKELPESKTISPHRLRTFRSGRVICDSYIHTIDRFTMVPILCYELICKSLGTANVRIVRISAPFGCTRFLVKHIPDNSIHYRKNQSSGHERHTVRAMQSLSLSRLLLATSPSLRRIKPCKTRRGRNPTRCRVTRNEERFSYARGISTDGRKVGKLRVSHLEC